MSEYLEIQSVQKNNESTTCTICMCHIIVADRSSMELVCGHALCRTCALALSEASDGRKCAACPECLATSHGAKEVTECTKCAKKEFTCKVCARCSYDPELTVGRAAEMCRRLQALGDIPGTSGTEKVQACIKCAGKIAVKDHCEKCELDQAAEMCRRLQWFCNQPGGSNIDNWPKREKK